MQNALHQHKEVNHIYVINGTVFPKVATPSAIAARYKIPSSTLLFFYLLLHPGHGMFWKSNVDSPMNQCVRNPLPILSVRIRLRSFCAN